MSKKIKINLSTQPRRNSKLIITRVLVIVLVGLIGSGMGFYYSKAKNELRDLEAINMNLIAKNAPYEDLQENLEKQLNLEKEFKAKAKHVEELTQTTPMLSKAFSEIEGAVTPDVQVIDLEITRDKVLITGLSTDFTEVAKTLAALRESEIITNAGLISSQKVIDSNVVFFEIETMWEAPVDEIN